MKMTNVRRIWLGGLAAGMLLVAGCQVICKKNVTHGIPSILCQPLDTGVTRGQLAVLKVEVAEAGSRYHWYKQETVPDGCKAVSQASRPGGLTAELKFVAATDDDGGQYYCEIVRDVEGEFGEGSTRTRLADLRVYPPHPSFRIPQLMTASVFTTNSGVVWISPQYSSKKLLTAAPGSGACLPRNYVASLPYNVDDAAYTFKSPPQPSGGTVVKCELSVTQVMGTTRTPLLNSGFAARWSTSGAGNTGCATDKATDNTIKDFTVTRFAADHTFTIYFVTAPPTGATNELKVVWR